jgi:Lar family restriction alleviation protein
MPRESKEQRSRRLHSERQRRYYEKTKADGVSPSGTVRVVPTLRLSPENAEYLAQQENKAAYIARLIDADRIGNSGSHCDIGLLPCPFCGGTDITSEYFDSMDCDTWRVACVDCGAEVNDSECDRAAAESAWNRRAIG